MSHVRVVHVLRLPLDLRSFAIRMAASLGTVVGYVIDVKIRFV